MTREEIVRFFDRRQAALNRRDAVALTSLHRENGVLESVMAGTLIGREAIQQFYESLFAAFPDFSYEPGELVIDGNRVVQKASFGGTDIGGFMGLPPTNKRVRVPAMFLFVMDDGHIERLESIYDFTRMLVEVGVLKVKPT